MRRKVPVHCEWPIIRSIQMNPDFMKLVRANRKRPALKKPPRMRCALVITDTQNGYSRDMRTGILTPYHDRRAWELACMLAEKEQPETIILIGDHCDLPDWSDKFQRTSEMYFTTQPMLLELHWWLARLRSICPDAEIVFIEGNHEDRLKRAIVNNMINAWGLQSVNDFKRNSVPTMSIENLLSLNELGIRYLGPYPEGEFWINDNIKAEHGNIAKNKPQETARAILQRSRSSTIFGHVHRREMASKNEYRRGGFVTYIAECFGCMCHLDGRVPSHEQKHQWNQGMGLVWYEPGNGLFKTEHVPIHEGHAIYGKEVLVGQPDVSAIERDCNWRFTD
jgi:UDP-2,3-diacylglucosamine pyrophosphatase LpxH